MKLYVGNKGRGPTRFYFDFTDTQGPIFIDIPQGSVKEVDVKDKDTLAKIVEQHKAYGFTDVTNHLSGEFEVKSDLVYSVDKPLYSINLGNFK